MAPDFLSSIIFDENPNFAFSANGWLINTGIFTFNGPDTIQGGSLSSDIEYGIRVSQPEEGGGNGFIRFGEINTAGDSSNLLFGNEYTLNAYGNIGLLIDPFGIIIGSSGQSYDRLSATGLEIGARIEGSILLQEGLNNFTIESTSSNALEIASGGSIFGGRTYLASEDLPTEFAQDFIDAYSENGNGIYSEGSINLLGVNSNDANLYDYISGRSASETGIYLSGNSVSRFGIEGKTIIRGVGGTNSNSSGIYLDNEAKLIAGKDASLQIEATGQPGTLGGLIMLGDSQLSSGNGLTLEGTGGQYGAYFADNAQVNINRGFNNSRFFGTSRGFIARDSAEINLSRDNDLITTNSFRVINNAKASLRGGSQDLIDAHQEGVGVQNNAVLDFGSGRLNALYARNESQSVSPGSFLGSGVFVTDNAILSLGNKPVTLIEESENGEITIIESGPIGDTLAYSENGTGVFVQGLFKTGYTSKLFSYGFESGMRIEAEGEVISGSNKAFYEVIGLKRHGLEIESGHMNMKGQINKLEAYGDISGITLGSNNEDSSTDKRLRIKGGTNTVNAVGNTYGMNINSSGIFQVITSGQSFITAAGDTIGTMIQEGGLAEFRGDTNFQSDGGFSGLIMNGRLAGDNQRQVIQGSGTMRGIEISGALNLYGGDDILSGILSDSETEGSSASDGFSLERNLTDSSQSLTEDQSPFQPETIIRASLFTDINNDIIDSSIVSDMPSSIDAITGIDMPKDGIYVHVGKEARMGRGNDASVSRHYGGDGTINYGNGQDEAWGFGAINAVGGRGFDTWRPYDGVYLIEGTGSISWDVTNLSYEGIDAFSETMSFEGFEFIKPADSNSLENLNFGAIEFGQTALLIVNEGNTLLI